MRREIVILCERWKDGKMERCTKDDKAGPSESPSKQAAANCQATSALLAAPSAGQSPVAPGERSGPGVRLPTAYFDSLGVPRCWEALLRNRTERPDTDQHVRVV
jgi:hypothetical protein